MGILDRVLGRSAPEHRFTPASPAPAAVLDGYQTLEVVGESHYQDALWHLAGGRCSERVRCDVRAVLAHEPANLHDSNAIEVTIDGHRVGYLSREDAIVYLPGLQRLTQEHGGPIALQGQIVGGGERLDGIGMLGVFLDHDPADFGLRTHHVAHIGELRTGFSQALATDLEDDSYDLSWASELSGNAQPSDIAVLRRLLDAETDPIDRHFMFLDLQKCLYRSRDAFASALEEFDAACHQHDSEMDTIRSALYEKFGCVPVIEMYRQAAIRCQKARDWPTMRSWIERGLSVYGSDAARPEAVADLEKRLAYADSKIAAASRPRAATRPVVTQGEVEILLCVGCGAEFRRVRTRGRKPHRCPECRAAA